MWIFCKKGQTANKMEICPNHKLRTSAVISTNNKRKYEYRNLNISNLDK